MSSGSSLLVAFLERHQITHAAAARAIGVSRPNMHDWLAATKRPRAERRAAIERWTSGEVPASAWSTAAELSEVDALEPFRPSTGTEG
jgi:DNA-binding transcriptional regulator YdaS (Cro superfamily)